MGKREAGGVVVFIREAYHTFDIRETFLLIYKKCVTTFSTLSTPYPHLPTNLPVKYSKIGMYPFDLMMATK